MARNFKRVRMFTRLAVGGLVAAGLATSAGLGTPSSFGVGQFFLLCPLGGVEALLASKTLVPQAVVSMAVVLLLAVVFGRSWCSWGCPAKAVRGLAGRKDARRDRAACAPSLRETLGRDTRLWVLAGVLLATFAVGFPVFCLVCPVGLTVGTFVSLWRLVQFNEVGLSLVVFPAALVIEMVAMRKWCLSFCPIAGLLSLAGRLSRVFRPRVEVASCLKARGGSCGACEAACPEAISLHAADCAAQLADCTRCGLCAQVCPADAIDFRGLRNPVKAAGAPAPEGGVPDEGAASGTV